MPIRAITACDLDPERRSLVGLAERPFLQTKRPSVHDEWSFVKTKRAARNDERHAP
jgi:hypothetical protein